MPRTGKITPRTTQPDPVYENLLLGKLINTVMRQGKKTIAQRHVYTALELMKDRGIQDPLVTFEAAVRNLTPQMEVRSRRVGGAAYQVPTPIKGSRGSSLALRWLIRGARNRPNSQYKTFSEKLATEILDAATGEGEAFQRKMTAHKMAEANKAFAHFRW